MFSTAAISFALVASLLARDDRIEAKEVWRISRAGAQPLNTVTNAVADRNDNVYLGQGRDGQVHVLGKKGQFLHSLGRQGSGPGEFALISRLGFLNDTIWVSDPQQRRITFFDGQSLVRSKVGTTQLEEFPFRESLPAALVQDGHNVVVPDYLRGTPDSPVRVSNLPVLRTTREGKIVDTLTMLRLRNTDLLVDLRKHGGPPLVGRQPFTDDPIWAASPMGDSFVVIERAVVGSRRSQFVEVVEFDALNNWRRKVVRIPYSPNRISSAARRAMIAREVGIIGARLGNQVSASALRAAFEKAVYIPEAAPLVERVFIASDRRVWLGMPVDDNARSQEWLVVDVANGKTRRASFPAGIRLLTATRTFVWGAVEDDTGEVSLVCFSIGNSA